MSPNAVDSWTPDIWTKINGQPGEPNQPGLLKTVMGSIRVAQKVFPTKVQGNDNAISADTVDLKTGIPSANRTRPVILVTKQFQLAEKHVTDTPDLSLVMHQVSLAGQTLALLEDRLYFQGQRASIPPDVTVTVAGDLQDGLLGIAKANPADNPTISVCPHGDGTYGTATFDKVNEGISQFTTNLQGPPYALILDPATFADAHRPLQYDSMVSPAKAIRELVSDGGFYMSPGLPAKTGLLVSLGGMATTLYIGIEPVVQFTQLNGSTYFFTAHESLQFYNIHPLSLIELDFQPVDTKKKS